MESAPTSPSRSKNSTLVKMPTSDTSKSNVSVVKKVHRKLRDNLNIFCHNVPCLGTYEPKIQNVKGSPAHKFVDSQVKSPKNV